MTLRTAHIVLMSATLALGVIMIAYGINEFASHDDAQGLGLAAGGGVVAVGVSFYLRGFIRKSRDD